MPSNRKPPPSITVIGNPPDANRHEYHGGRYAQNSCKGKRHPDGMPSDKKIKIIQVSDVAFFYCPAEIKEIAEIIVTDPREVLSAISVLSVGHYCLMRIVFYCPDFYCPAVIGFAASLVEEIKEIAEIIVTDPREVLSAISAISVGHYSMRIIFIVPRK